ncbi:ABC transporter ATP-binding protein [Anaerosacchariphilus polymeriproducens]|uniref:ABC transporter ATP-binding protein n=1 Tax=Anaerosacchariphilus polymeriproducens TaxID=1812858 RepID=A0A371ASE7_9FIRM|nr:ABC transporter ATP-binding protein [Anaerosacchariphilus polymeriproducens]RDU22491.1 ABC transporter ATP-binding protein [Anaerosacchariphilus polymeriproducens]
MDYALEIRNLTKKYNGFTLDHINLALPSGCIMGFIGENGAGKTTTIKLILDLIKKDSGEIYILGEEISKSQRILKEKIGVVMDECCFPENLDIKEINFIMKKIYKTWDESLFRQYYTRFGLKEKQPVKEYSRGMKMKLSITCALSHGSQILILDEATSGLDPIVRDEILDVFLEFIQDERHSIFISSHIISDLEKICDYITFLHKGKIIFNDSKDLLLEKYGVLKCSESELKTVDSSAIIGYRKSGFGVEALVEREKIAGSLLVDPASIEDIMLYYIREGKK